MPADPALAQATAPAPPRAPRKPVTAVHHGVEVVDDYAWLRAPNWQEVMRDPSVLEPEIRSYLEAENAYTAHMLADTKALQEKLVAAAHQRYRGLTGTIFSCVRYGNVLGSRGSVVPLFKGWIERKEPLRITDPRMTRFLLTLDDAVDLVLKAARDAEGGELFVRKSPAHTIGDLAHAMIQAAGFDPRDYPVHAVGTRPGEKLYEELFFDSESALPTGHPKVLRAKNGVLPIGLSTVVDLLVDGARAGWPDEQLRNLLVRLVPDFRISAAEVEADVELPISSIPR